MEKKVAHLSIVEALGDPLPPFLFVLATDALQRMLTAAATSLQSSLSSKVSQPFFILQYADDTLLFSFADPTTLKTLKLTLCLFSKVSGLNINYSKSSFVPFNIDPPASISIERLLCCARTLLPLTYLGLPLTLTRPKK